MHGIKWTKTPKNNFYLIKGIQNSKRTIEKNYTKFSLWLTALKLSALHNKTEK